ncbi:MAG: glycosyltransferase family 4 protein [Proteobacteria bacterium]|nr:glycosyltransferase family 4 protein [Pseudomonadota bacterium]
MLNVCYLISGDLWAGAEVMAYHLLRGLQAYEGLSLSVILLNEGILAEKIRESGIRVHVVDESQTSFFNILLTIRKILNKQTPDVIHSHRYKENILAYLTTRFFRRIKLIGTQHGMLEVHERKTSLRQRLISRCNFFLLSRCFHRVVGVSQDIKNAFVKQYGFKEDFVSVIHNGVEIPDIPSMRGNRDSFVIGSSGRLFPVKDYHLMVEIARLILRKTNHIRFQLAGDGPERSKLQALIQDYGLDSLFELKGHLNDISAFYRDLDLYLNTSIHEGIPMSVLEAMAHGLPVIAPNVGGLREIVDDEVGGYLLEGRNPEAYADKCLLLYENKPLRQRISQAAREKVVRAFSMENMAQQYYNIYLDLAKKS